MKRVFLIVLDSVGIGEMPDAADYGDAGSNTILAASKSPYFSMPNMRKLGFFNIDGVHIGEKEQAPTGAFARMTEVSKGKEQAPTGAFARMTEVSKGKDTTIGHWEIAGVISPKPLPTFPNGFPAEFIREFEARTGKGTICNRPYSGTEVIKDFGDEHVTTGKLIVYTSADSVFQIAAHEDIVPVDKLYEYCEIARELLTGELGVGRVIARPFIGADGNYTRTANRHDFSLEPPKITMLDEMIAAGRTVLSVGKIVDIFAGRGITEYVRTKDNADGINQTLAYMDKDFEGLCFTNLVDYDMLYGHRNDVDGYAKALAYFDERLPELLSKLGEEDILMITADHGCDPSTPSTDHSREYTPFVLYGKPVPAGKNYGTRESFADIAATILQYFEIKKECAGEALPL